MTTRPTIAPLFATDATLGTGVESALVPRLDPGSGIRARGFLGSTRAPGRWFNFLLGLLGDWLAYLDQKTRNEDSILSHGALIDGTTDDTVAFQATVDALAAIGGGKVLVPFGATGICRITNKITWPRGVSLYLVPGVSILFDHASHNVFEWTATSSTGQGPDTFDNVWVEGAQAAAGTLFFFATYAEVVFRNCRCNILNGLMQGDILNQLALAPVRFEDCLLLSNKTGSAAYVLGGAVQFRGGEISLASAATANLITGTGELLLDRVTLSHTGSSTNKAFVSLTTGLRVQVVGCRMNRATTDVTYLLDIAGNAFVDVSGCDLQQADNVDNVYKYTSGTLAAGSKLQFDLSIPREFFTTSATIPNGAASFGAKCGAATSPAITLPLAFVDRELDVMLENSHGSGNWGSDFIIFNPQGTDVVRYSSTGLDALPSGSAISVRFHAVLDPVSLVRTWTQIGAHQVLS